MKHSLSFGLLIIFSISTFSQEKIITPPLGLSFGTNQIAFRAVLDKFGTFKTVTNQSYGTCVSYEDVKIGATKASILFGKFVDNKLFEVSALYIVDDENIQKKYDELCQIITNKYGKGDETRKFRYPFTDGDEHFVTAVKQGYTDISTLWVLTNGISVSIDKIPAIKLLYQCTELYDLVEKNNENKNKTQF